ncbi:hypothetical protein DPMN_036371 [Dreissena polymorpha]|uniref:DEAD/DEAH box helicase domain-containing protein n=1 Tax=Dreissena polymorpha TaxID=45954 RepID=A0A9D4MCF1_DREPO|nr:hypothetical protein DPMN_036371 [Dreissena polymorpha]
MGNSLYSVTYGSRKIDAFGIQSGFLGQFRHIGDRLSGVFGGRICLTPLGGRYYIENIVLTTTTMASFEHCVKVSLTKLKANIELKQQQLDVLQAVFDGKDTIAVLPTGFGKSLLFQMLPYLMAVRLQKFHFAITIDFINPFIPS